MTLKLNLNLNKKCYFLNLDKGKTNIRKSMLMNDLNKSKDNHISSFENFDFLVFSFSDENLKYLHDFNSNYKDYISDNKKIGKILKSKIYGNNFENEFLHLESINHKKIIEHFKLKMNLIIKKMEHDEKDLKLGKIIEPAYLVKGIIIIIFI